MLFICIIRKLIYNCHQLYLFNNYFLYNITEVYMSIYDYIVKDAEGKDVKLKKYEGKVLLIVNTATKCGFTKQYPALQDLYKKYKKEGFEILDFPCNQFGGQAKEPIEEIAKFRKEKFKVTFKLFDKVKVNSKNADPLFIYLKSEKPSEEGVEKIRWNFGKFLIDREGNIAGRYDPRVKPEELDEIVAELLKN